MNAFHATTVVQNKALNAAHALTNAATHCSAETRETARTNTMNAMMSKNASAGLPLNFALVMSVEKDGLKAVYTSVLFAVKDFNAKHLNALKSKVIVWMKHL